jgi:ankyrin repeat protein
MPEKGIFPATKDDYGWTYAHYFCYAAIEETNLPQKEKVTSTILTSFDEKVYTAHPSVIFSLCLTQPSSVGAILDKYQMLSLQQLSNGNNLLHWVAFIKNITLLSELISLSLFSIHKSNLWEQENTEGETPHHYVALYADTNIYRDFFYTSIDSSGKFLGLLKVRNKQGLSSLDILAQSGKTGVLSALGKESGIDSVFTVLDDHHTPLYHLLRSPEQAKAITFFQAYPDLLTRSSQFYNLISEKTYNSDTVIAYCTAIRTLLTDRETLAFLINKDNGSLLKQLVSNDVVFFHLKRPNSVTILEILAETQQFKLIECIFKKFGEKLFTYFPDCLEKILALVNGNEVLANIARHSPALLCVPQGPYSSSFIATLIAQGNFLCLFQLINANPEVIKPYIIENKLTTTTFDSFYHFVSSAKEYIYNQFEEHVDLTTLFRDMEGNHIIHYILNQGSIAHPFILRISKLNVLHEIPNNRNELPIHIVAKRSLASLKAYLGTRAAPDKTTNASATSPDLTLLACKTLEGKNVLHILSQHFKANDTASFCEFIKRNPTLLFEQDTEGKTPLFYLAFEGLDFFTSCLLVKAIASIDKSSQLLQMKSNEGKMCFEDLLNPLAFVAFYTYFPFIDEEPHFRKVETELTRSRDTASFNFKAIYKDWKHIPLAFQSRYLSLFYPSEISYGTRMDLYVSLISNIYYIKPNSNLKNHLRIFSLNSYLPQYNRNQRLYELSYGFIVLLQGARPLLPIFRTCF